MSDFEHNAGAAGHDAKPKGDQVTANNKYEAMVQRLAFAAVNEQRRARRWRIFFIILTFIYLTPVVLLTMDVSDLNVFDKSSEGSDKHTALVKLDG